MNDSYQLLKYCLHLADDALVLGHRNSEWTGHGPILEQDIALSNISLDLIGQARNFYQLAASLQNDETTEDDLAYLRSADDFLNCLLVEQPNGHWGTTVLRQFFYSAYAFPLYTIIQHHSGRPYVPIAEKSLKEVTYHLRWSSEWVIRLGQGTVESHEKMQSSLDELWKFTGELYLPESYEPVEITALDIESQWRLRVDDVLKRSGLVIPETVKMEYGGKQGSHTAHLENLLNEMQFMQRTYPGMQW